MSLTKGAPAHLSYTVEELKQFECPICMQLPRSGPVYQCTNGHIICSSCRTSVKKCPQCRVRLGDTRSLVIEPILDKLSFPCQYEEEGCSLVMLRKYLVSHEKKCPFRMINCVDFRCKRKIPMSKLVDHVRNNHSHIPTLRGLTVMMGMMMSGRLRVSSKDQSQCEDKDFYPYQLKVKGTYFYLNCKRVEEMWYMWVSIVDIEGANATDFKYTLLIHNEDESSKLQYQNHPAKIDMKFSKIQRLGKYLAFTEYTAKDFLIDNRICWKVSIDQ